MPRKKKIEIIIQEPKKYKVIRDVQEKKGYWEFQKSKYCDGVIDQHLLTGDYTLEGFEDIFALERKASTGELAGNVCTKQFVNELKRADRDLKHFFVICEFSLDDVMRFPYGSGIPKGVWNRLKITSHLLLKRIVEFELEHNVTFVFCGNADNAKEFASSVFKRMIEKYGNEINGEAN